MQQLLANLVFMTQRSQVSSMLLSDIHFFLFLSVSVTWGWCCDWTSAIKSMHLTFTNWQSNFVSHPVSLYTFENMLQASSTTLFPFTMEGPFPSSLLPENINDIELQSHCHLFEMQITRFSKCRLDWKEKRFKCSFAARRHRSFTDLESVKSVTGKTMSWQKGLIHVQEQNRNYPLMVFSHRSLKNSQLQRLQALTSPSSYQDGNKFQN